MLRTPRRSIFAKTYKTNKPVNKMDVSGTNQPVLLISALPVKMFLKVQLMIALRKTFTLTVCLRVYASGKSAQMDKVLKLQPK